LSNADADEASADRVADRQMALDQFSGT